MKKAINLFLALSSFQLALANSRYVTLSNVEQAENVLATDLVEIVGVAATNTNVRFDQPDGTDFIVGFNSPTTIPNTNNPILKHIYTGATAVTLTRGSAVTLKITPQATTETVSKPVTIPPTSASDTTVNIQLQVSTDLRNWEDVVPGEFLGSNTLRFFRIRVTSQSAD